MISNFNDGVGDAAAGLPLSTLSPLSVWSRVQPRELRQSVLPVLLSGLLLEQFRGPQLQLYWFRRLWLYGLEDQVSFCATIWARAISHTATAAVASAAPSWVAEPAPASSFLPIRRSFVNRSAPALEICHDHIHNIPRLICLA